MKLKLEDLVFLINVSLFADIIFNSKKMTNLKREIKCTYLKKIDKLYINKHS